jgi:hypothetical protein
MRNEGCPVKGKTRRDCWKKCPVAELFRHGQTATADRMARKMGCPESGLNDAKRIGNA